MSLYNMEKCTICNKTKKDISFGYTGDKKDAFCRQCKENISYYLEFSFINDIYYIKDKNNKVVAKFKKRKEAEELLIKLNK